MIAQIFPRSYRRYITLPLLGPILEEYTSWANKQGYSIFSVKESLKYMVKINRFMRRHGTKDLCELTHDSFETAWKYYHRKNLRIAGTIRQIERFLDEAHRIQPLPSPPVTPITSELTRFADYLHNVRGLAVSNINQHLRYTQEFLNHLGYDSNANILSGISTKEIEMYIGNCAKRLNRHSLKKVISILRNFLRYEYEQNTLPKPIHTQIDTPRIYRFEKLPRSLPWEKVENFLSSIDRSDAHGLRNYTMFFLIASYGLRTCEIVSLTLDDIDWRAGILRIFQKKTDNHLFLPLTDAVREVLIEYLKKSRPSLPYRELFLRVNAPDGPLKPCSVSTIFQRQVLNSGIDIPYNGAHCLRHSYAVHLLRQGTSLKTIGDLLGHQNTNSTYGYLRLAVEDLRDVALPVPDGPGITEPIQIIVSKYMSSYVKDPERVSRDTSFKSFLREEMQNYLQLKLSLGRRTLYEASSFRSLDSFIVKEYPLLKELTAEIFNQWCLTLNHLSISYRRRQMLDIHSFCLYRCRSKPNLFVPDPMTFPANKHHRFISHIFSESDIARLISATQYLRPYGQCCPIRSQILRIGIILLYTTGLRIGELLRLKLGDYDSTEKTLLIRDTKFHKSRIIPLSPSVTAELNAFLELRLNSHLPMDITSPLMWSGRDGAHGKGYSKSAFSRLWRTLCITLGIFTKTGNISPRIHDLRHSFAVNVLQGWYQSGEDVQAKIPLLSTYMGHSHIHSTFYYLSFVEGIRSQASARFQRNFGSVITVDIKD